MQVGNKRVVVKPAMVVLISGIVVAIAVIAVAGYYASYRVPSTGLVNPKRWKFETRSGAQAEIKPYSPLKSENGTDGVQLIDAESGFDVKVTQSAASADRVFLRNGLNLDMVNAQTLDLTFEGRAPKPFPVIVTIRDLEISPADNPAPLWRQAFLIDSSDWKGYQATVPVPALRKSAQMNLVAAVQMGDHQGIVSLRRIRLR